MAKAEPAEIQHKPNFNLVVHNPATGQTMQTTSKLFDALYRDKGLELVERGTEIVAASVRRNGSGLTRDMPISKTGSAADIAAALNLTEGIEGGGMTFKEAGARAMARDAEREAVLQKGREARNIKTGSANMADPAEIIPANNTVVGDTLDDNAEKDVPYLDAGKGVTADNELTGAAAIAAGLETNGIEANTINPSDAKGPTPRGRPRGRR